MAIEPPKGLVGNKLLGTPASVTGGQGSILPTPPPTAAPPIPAQQGFQAPTPGVSGVTPGAVERRLTGLSAIPPTAQGAPMTGMPPTAQAQMALGNTVGADPRSLTDPVAMIRQLLQGRQQVQQ